MKLWTIQRIEAYEKFKREKILVGDVNYVDEYFLRAYNWTIEQMTQRIKNYSRVGSSYPIWAWYQWGDVKHKKPDLRYSAHLSPGTKGVRIELEVDENKVLLSDFELYHFVLGYWYICESFKDDHVFYKEVKNKGFKFHDLSDFSKREIDLLRFREKIEKSWERIFDLDWHKKGISRPKDQKGIQAVMWSIDWDEVVNVKEFIAR